MKGEATRKRSKNRSCIGKLKKNHFRIPGFKVLECHSKNLRINLRMIPGLTGPRMKAVDANCKALDISRDEKMLLTRYTISDNSI